MIISNSKSFSINSSFLEKLPELDFRYLPTHLDVLLLKRKTLGLTSAEFNDPIVRYQLFDVGGRRNERKKWEKSFENANVIYTVSLSEYDQKLYEDDITNRMLESLELFESTINGLVFTNKPVFLVFTKYKIFQEKIKKKDLSSVFSDYQGGNDENKALEFIINKYKEKNKNQSRELFIHVLDITDTDQVQNFIINFTEESQKIKDKLCIKSEN